MAKEKKDSISLRVKEDAIKNCTNIATKLGHPFTFNNIVEHAMLLISAEQILENLNKKK